MKLNDKVEVAKQFAAVIHEDAGQRYGDGPYSDHLEAVAKVLLRFDVIDRDLLASAYLHDIVEDCGVSLDVIKELFGEKVATLVSAVTDEAGLNRKERKAKTYPKIKALPEAVMIKLADRIANVEMSLKTSNERMFKMYRKEHDEFTVNLRTIGVCDQFWKALDTLITDGKMNKHENVHTRHCCDEHKHCKYGDDDCPVATGFQRADYRCNCEWM
jgi:(p)ppGpp synthase/HD superfamily hydrolase